MPRHIQYELKKKRDPTKIFKEIFDLLYRADLTMLDDMIHSSFGSDEYIPYSLKVALPAKETVAPEIGEKFDQMVTMVQSYVNDWNTLRARKSTQAEDRSAEKTALEDSFEESCQDNRNVLVQQVKKCDPKKITLNVEKELAKAIFYRPLKMTPGMVFKNNIEGHLQTILSAFNTQFDVMFQSVNGLRLEYATAKDTLVEQARVKLMAACSRIQSPEQNDRKEEISVFPGQKSDAELQIIEHFKEFLSTLNEFGLEQFKKIREVSESIEYCGRLRLANKKCESRSTKLFRCGDVKAFKQTKQKSRFGLDQLQSRT